MTDFARLCKKGEYYAKRDKVIFMMWEEDEIDTNTCIKAFLANSMYPRVKIDPIHFENWLNSLGYYNRDTKKNIPQGCYKVNN